MFVRGKQLIKEKEVLISRTYVESIVNDHGETLADDGTNVNRPRLLPRLGRVAMTDDVDSRFRLPAGRQAGMTVTRGMKRKTAVFT